MRGRSHSPREAPSPFLPAARAAPLGQEEEHSPKRASGLDLALQAALRAQCRGALCPGDSRPVAWLCSRASHAGQSLQAPSGRLVC